jgi:TPP-dependent pyruvate/acetoin dehydrogenase alpha subunit
LIDSGLATAEELKEIEREVREQVQKSLAEAVAGKAPEVRSFFHPCLKANA